MSARLKYSAVTLAVTLAIAINANAASIINLTQQTKSHPILSRSRTMPSAAPMNYQPKVTLDKKTSYRIISEVKLNNGKTKYRLQQIYDGLEVYGYTIVSEKNTFSNVIDAQVIGSAVNDIAQKDNFITPTIHEDKAIHHIS